MRLPLKSNLILNPPIVLVRRLQARREILNLNRNLSIFDGERLFVIAETLELVLVGELRYWKQQTDV